MARDYGKEYRSYHASPTQKSRRAARNAARRQLEKQGRVSKGDGKDVHHRDGNAENNKPSNLRVVSRKRNRGALRVKGR
jgi:hypothetical protein